MSLILETQKIIRTFYERYVSRFDSERGDYHRIEAMLDEEGHVFVRFFINDYHLNAWVDEKDELHIQTSDGADIFKLAEYFDWNDETVHFIRFGKIRELPAAVNDIPLEKIRQFAFDKNTDIEDEGSCIGFDYCGSFIANPWMDPSSRYELNDADSVKQYGFKNVLSFCEKAAEKIKSNS